MKKPKKTPPPLVTHDADFAARMDTTSRRRAEIMARVNGRYLETKRDRTIDTEIQLLIESLTFSSGAAHGNRKCLCIIGHTGAGKTTLVRRAIATKEAFAPRVTQMTTTAPVMSVKAIRPSSFRVFVEDCLEELQYPHEGERLREAPAWRMLRRQLKARGVRVLHIDEAQHLVNVRDVDAMSRLSDALKTIIDDIDAPVGIILSGMPELEDFLLMHPQLNRRSHIIRLEALEYPRNKEVIRWIVETIVQEDAGMMLAFDLNDEFLARLCHGAAGAFGSVTQIVRAAIERVLVDDVGGRVVNHAHFAKAYALISGCRPAENVMNVVDWQTVTPGNALLREEDDAYLRAMDAVAERRARSRGRRRGRGSR